MNKNLKKVISATAALAISASGVAAFAASYPDVADTASYKQAVDELSALNIVNGYEDGTFQPDKNVTRAEITKMVVTALGDTVLNSAEAAKGRDTQFTDVPGTHWAAGYISVGTSSQAGNFINGYSATEFGPEDNVTFAQAMKMLVGALGYTYYSEQNGGWPNGYLSYGYKLGISDGVTGVTNDQQVTRAQVAQMIDNALKAPICIVTQWTENILGQSTPELLVKDGTGDSTGKDGYQNLLNYAHDAYLVYGRVQGTHKSDSSIDSDQVSFSVERSDNWNGYPVTKGSSDIEENIRENMYIGNSNADSYLLTYSEAIIQQDDNDEYTILSITPYGSNESIAFKADDLAEDKTTLAPEGRSTIYAYQSDTSSRTTSYKLDTDKIYAGEEGGFYVNGKQLNASNDADLQALLDTYVKNADGTSVNLSGEVTLIDAPAAGTSTTDGSYDYIMVTYYATGVVDSVSGTETNPTIYFSDGSSGVSRLAVDYDDEDYDYEILLNDEQIKATDLQEGDVLSIAYDVEQGFANSESYTILVSRGNVVEGQCRTVNSDQDEFTMDNGTKYQVAYDGVGKLEAGTSYTLYLDVFGNIAKVEDLASAKNIAILDNVYQSASGENYAQIITPDGRKESYAIRNDSNADTYANIVYTDGNGVQSDNASRTKEFVANRVVEYNVNSSNYFTVRSTVTENGTERPAALGWDTYAYDEDYKSSTNRIGSIRITDGITNIVDLSDYYDDDKYDSKGQTEGTISGDGSYASMAVSSLTDGDSYTAYAYARTSSDRVAQFVIIVEGTSGLNVNSPMAVYASESIGRTPNDTDATIISAYVNGELTEVYMDNTSSTGMSEGDLFFYTTNSDGEVEPGDLVRVYAEDGMLNAGYASLYDTVLVNDNDSDDKIFDVLSSSAKNFSTWSKNSSIRDDECAIVFGAITDRSGSSVNIASTVDFESDRSSIANIDNVTDYTLASDVTVYKYDYSMRADSRVSVGAVADIARTTFSRDAYADEDKIYVDFASTDLTDGMTSTYGKVNFAVAKVVDDEITEILVITPNPSNR